MAEPADFGGDARSLIIPIELNEGDNQLKVEVRGQPGRSLSLSLERCTESQ